MLTINVKCNQKLSLNVSDLQCLNRESLTTPLQHCFYRPFGKRKRVLNYYVYYIDLSVTYTLSGSPLKVIKSLDMHTSVYKASEINEEKASEINEEVYISSSF